jgi:hypothetical protein
MMPSIHKKIQKHTSERESALPWRYHQKTIKICIPGIPFCKCLTGAYTDRPAIGDQSPWADSSLIFHQLSEHHKHVYGYHHTDIVTRVPYSE